ncbi:MAG TPA: ATP-binding cassette domain-containing protein [Sulfurivirga caldicuralii]|nr:ATP-binding cassette domain-containing protein [Sulfurivirga caldicuralii]
MSDSILIQAQALTYAYGDKVVLNHVDFTLHKGEILTLIGPNGAGKTTLLKLVLGLLQPTDGRLWRKPSMTIGYMPQKLHHDPSLPLTTARFLQLGLKPKQPLDPYWIEKIGVTAYLQQPLHSLSGGQLQRAMLCRAVMRQPDLLVLDEPLQGVDVQGQAHLYRLLVEIRETLGCAILMVSHDLHLVMAQTDRVVCLNGHICCSGTPQSVREHPEYLRLFGEQDTVFAIYAHHHDPDRCASHGTHSHD